MYAYPVSSASPLLSVFGVYLSIIYKVNKMAKKLKEVKHGIPASRIYRLRTKKLGNTQLQ